MDFFLKKCCEVFIKNVFIYTSQFFGEKYFIEVLTKKIIDKYIFLSSKYFTVVNLTYSSFFLIITLIFFYSYIIYLIFILT